MTDRGLYPAEHRALRELHASVRYLRGHWRKLAERLGDAPALAAGAAEAGALLDELVDRTAAFGLHGFPAAQGVGGSGAGLRRAGDVFLERNQALRVAVLDAQHVTTLLGYLRALADTRGDAALAAWHGGWEERMRAAEEAARAAAVDSGRSPELAVEPAEGSALGRAGHSVASGLGTLGEAIDASPLGRAARRLGR